MIGITFSGLNDVMRMFEELGKDELYESTMDEVADRAKDYAEQLSPVDTGTLRESINVIKRGTEFELYADAPYAVFNEYGSIFTPIGSVDSPKPAKYAGFRPFLRPAAYKAMREVDYIFGKKVGQITSHGGRA